MRLVPDAFALRAGGGSSDLVAGVVWLVLMAPGGRLPHAPQT
ncbi:hypothetical protein AB0K80_07230 [Streptomyces sp. NPDC052682]